MADKIKVYVGCAPNGEDAESLMVLDYSIRKHTDRPIDVVRMHVGAHPNWTGWDMST